MKQFNLEFKLNHSDVISWTVPSRNCKFKFNNQQLTTIMKKEGCLESSCPFYTTKGLNVFYSLGITNLSIYKAIDFSNLLSSEDNQTNLSDTQL